MKGNGNYGYGHPQQGNFNPNYNNGFSNQQGFNSNNGFGRANTFQGQYGNQPQIAPSYLSMPGTQMRSEDNQHASYLRTNQGYNTFNAGQFNNHGGHQFNGGYMQQQVNPNQRQMNMLQVQLNNLNQQVQQLINYNNHAQQTGNLQNVADSRIKYWNVQKQIAQIKYNIAQLAGNQMLINKAQQDSQKANFELNSALKYQSDVILQMSQTQSQIQSHTVHTHTQTTTDDTNLHPSHREYVNSEELNRRAEESEKEEEEEAQERTVEEISDSDNEEREFNANNYVCEQFSTHGNYEDVAMAAGNDSNLTELQIEEVVQICFENGAIVNNVLSIFRDEPKIIAIVIDLKEKWIDQIKTFEDAAGLRIQLEEYKAKFNELDRTLTTTIQELQERFAENEEQEEETAETGEEESYADEVVSNEEESCNDKAESEDEESSEEEDASEEFGDPAHTNGQDIVVQQVIAAANTNILALNQFGTTQGVQQNPNNPINVAAHSGMSNGGSTLNKLLNIVQASSNYQAPDHDGNAMTNLLGFVEDSFEG